MDGRRDDGPSPAHVRRVLADGFRIVFQPIATVRGELAGVEALSRFPGHPWGPEQWFAAAEACGLGIELEERAIAGAFQMLAAVPPRCYLSINTSPGVLSSAGFARLLDDVDCERVAAEITEHASVSDYRALMDVVGGLRGRGLRIAIDDVGAGYANFRHLLEIAPDIVKVDMSLVRGIDADVLRQRVVHSLVDSPKIFMPA